MHAIFYEQDRNIQLFAKDSCGIFECVIHRDICNGPSVQLRYQTIINVLNYKCLQCAEQYFTIKELNCVPQEHKPAWC